MLFLASVNNPGLGRRLDWLHTEIKYMTVGMLDLKHEELKVQAISESKELSWAHIPIALVRKLMIFAGDDRLHTGPSNPVSLAGVVRVARELYWDF